MTVRIDMSTHPLNHMSYRGYSDCRYLLSQTHTWNSDKDTFLFNRQSEYKLKYPVIFHKQWIGYISRNSRTHTGKQMIFWFGYMWMWFKIANRIIITYFFISNFSYNIHFDESYIMHCTTLSSIHISKLAELRTKKFQQFFLEFLQNKFLFVAKMEKNWQNSINFSKISDSEIFLVGKNKKKKTIFSLQIYSISHRFKSFQKHLFHNFI